MMIVHDEFAQQAVYLVIRTQRCLWIFSIMKFNVLCFST